MLFSVDYSRQEFVRKLSFYATIVNQRVQIFVAKKITIQTLFDSKAF